MPGSVSRYLSFVAVALTSASLGCKSHFTGGGRLTLKRYSADNSLKACTGFGCVDGDRCDDPVHLQLLWGTFDGDTTTQTGQATSEQRLTQKQFQELCISATDPIPHTGDHYVDFTATVPGTTFSFHMKVSGL